MNREKLYNDWYEAWKKACSSIYPAGSNYWMEIFVDKLIECQNNKMSFNQQIDHIIELLENIKTK